MATKRKAARKKTKPRKGSKSAPTRSRAKRTPARRGARGKLTKTVSQAIVRDIKAGAFAVVAAARAGISERTFYRWRSRGETASLAAEQGVELDAEDALYCQFWQALAAAEAACEVTASRRFLKLGAKDWRATAEFLRRRFAKRWNPTEKLEHAEPPPRPRPMNLSALDDDELEVLERLLAKAAPEASG